MNHALEKQIKFVITIDIVQKKVVIFYTLIGYKKLKIKQNQLFIMIQILENHYLLHQLEEVLIRFYKNLLNMDGLHLEIQKLIGN